MEYYFITDLPQQLVLLVRFFLYGILVGLWAGVLKGLRWPACKLWQGVLDVLLWLVPSMGFFLLSLALYQGRLRLSLALAALLGAVCWRYTLGRLLQKLWRQLCLAASFPLRRAGSWWKKKRQAAAKREKSKKILEKNLGIPLKKTAGLMYNKAVSHFGSFFGPAKHQKGGSHGSHKKT